MNDLLRIGIETLAASLDDETIKTLFEIETSITADLYASGKIKSGINQMINLQGTLINAFRVDGGKGKDGKEYEARDKVQILVRWNSQTEKLNTNLLT